MIKHLLSIVPGCSGLAIMALDAIYFVMVMSWSQNGPESSPPWWVKALCAAIFLAGLALYSGGLFLYKVGIIEESRKKESRETKKRARFAGALLFFR